MSAVSDVDEYAKGLCQGVGDHLNGRPHRDMHFWTPRFRSGYQDGWDVAPRLAEESAADWEMLRGPVVPEDTPTPPVRLGFDFLGSDFPF